jgi:hypothetical protein
MNEFNLQMTLQELQTQALHLPISDRWHLVQTLLESLQQETQPRRKRGNLSQLRGIAKITAIAENSNPEEEYTTYLMQKYR